MSKRWVLVPLLVADIHALFVPAQSCGRRLEKSEIERLSVQRYVTIPGWLSDVQTDRLQADAAAVGACEHIFDCCVGSADGGARVDESVRITRQCTFFPPPPHEAGSTATRARLIDAGQPASYPPSHPPNHPPTQPSSRPPSHPCPQFNRYVESSRHHQ